IASEYTHSHGQKVSEVMTDEVQTADEDADLEAVVELMERHRIKRVSMARGEPAAPKGDAEIRERLLGEIKAREWAPAAMVNVVVRDGVVELWGAVIDDRQREALKVAAENIPGVKAVKDHLVWIEPTSGMVIEPPEEATKH